MLLLLPLPPPPLLLPPLLLPLSDPMSKPSAIFYAKALSKVRDRKESCCVCLWSERDEGSGCFQL